MTKKLTITVEINVPDGFYSANDNNIQGNITKSVEQTLKDMLTEYYSQLQSSSMSIVNIKES